MPVKPREIEFNSQGVRVRAGLFKAVGTSLRNNRGLPCVVMAHGLGGTRSAGLEPFAQRFAEAGLNVLVFDYRGFGASDGSPRQVVDVRAQLDDWTAAIAHARSLKEIDPRRIALWGSSFSGGHVVAAAVEDVRVAAVSSQGGMLDGLAALKHLLTSNGAVHTARISALASLDLARSKLGMPRVTLPVVGAPGAMAVLTTPDSEPGYLAITPCRCTAPTEWRHAYPAPPCSALPSKTLWCPRQRWKMPPAVPARRLKYGATRAATSTFTLTRGLRTPYAIKRRFT